MLLHGYYDIKLTDKAGNETVVQQPIYIADGLMGYWDADNNTGSGNSNVAKTWKDLSGNGNDGTINSATWGNNYLDFDGKDDYVAIGEMNYDNVTLEVVAEYKAITNAEQDIISNTQIGGYAIQKPLNNNKSIFTVYIQKDDGTAGYSSLQSNNSIQVNKKYYLAGTYDSITEKFYENGSKYSSTQIGKIKPPDDNTILALGVNPNKNTAANGYFNGKIYNARIYNRALTEEEIQLNRQVDNERYQIY